MCYLRSATSAPGSGLVDVEGADDGEFWVREEVADRDGDFFDDVFVYCVDVVFYLGRDGEDWGGLCNGAWKGGISKDRGFGGFVFTFDEFLNAPLVIDRLALFDKINLVLQYDDVVELHDLESCLQVLSLVERVG